MSDARLIASNLSASLADIVHARHHERVIRPNRVRAIAGAGAVILLTAGLLMGYAYALRRASDLTVKT